MPAIKSRKHAVPGATATTLTAASLLAGFALGLPGAALADETADTGDDARDQAVTLDKVDVQGQRVKRYSADKAGSPKFTQPLLDTTQTVNVIGSDLFNEQGATTLTDALRNSPGVGTFYVGENGNTTTGDAVYLRGFDTSGSIFVDGVRDLGSISRDVFNIEQIDVTKGPAGTDTGRSSPTGSINLISKQPYLRDANSASLSYGSDEQRRVTADFNQAVGAGGAAFRINLMAQDSGVPGRDEINRKRWAIAPSVAFGLDTATRLYVNLLHVDQNNVPDGGVPTIGLPGYSAPTGAPAQVSLAPRVDSKNFYGTSSDHDDVIADMLTFRFEHDFSDDVRLQNTTRWGRTQQDYLLTSFMLSVNVANPALSNLQTPDVNDPSTWTVARSLPTFKDQENRILANLTNLSAHFGSGDVQHDLSAGIEFSRENLDRRGIAAVAGTAWPRANLYDPDPNVSGLQWQHNGADAHGKTDTAAVYVFDTVKFGERWQVNGGVRVDRYRTDFLSFVACTATTCAGRPLGTPILGVDASPSDTLLNWKVGVLFKPAADGSLYANYAISQQPPGGANLELSSSANSSSNPAFDPQKAKTAELGVKWNFFDDALLLSGAVYDTKITNEVVLGDDGLYFQNGEKRVRGIELSAVGKISDAWSLSAGFTTMDTDVIAGPAITADGSTGLTYTPKSAFTAWTTYEFPFGLTIGGGARYSGGLKRGTDGATGTPAYTESYWVFDAVASYVVTPTFDLRLNVNNLADEEYVAAINKSGYRYSPGIPRSALLTANFRF
jgi:catecholate siderophore receptor